MEKAEEKSDLLQEYLENKYSSLNKIDREEKIAEYQSAIDFITDPKTRSKLESLFEGLDIDTKTKNKLLSHIEEKALEQHYDNPEQYVSHGFDHTLNVMTHMEKIMNDNPDIVKIMERKYGISPAESRILIKLVAIYHDFGYPEIGRLGKALHGVTGARIASSEKFISIMRDVATTNDAKFEEMMHDFSDAILFHSADKVEIYGEAKIKIAHGEFILDSENIIDVFSYYSEEDHEGSIEIVCNKKIEAKIKKKLDARKISYDTIIFKTPSETGDFVTEEGKFRGRKVDFEGSTNKKGIVLGLEYKEVSLNSDPMNFMIRLSDNLDMTMDRFSALQRTEAFQEIYRYFGPPSSTGELLVQLESCKKNGVPSSDEILSNNNFRNTLNDLEIAVDPSTDIKDLIKEYKEKIIEDIINDPSHSADIEKVGKEKLKEIGLYQSSQSIRHFGGCESVREVTLTPEGELIITVDQERFEELNRTQVAEKALKINGDVEEVRVGIGEYQIWRAYEAYRSLKSNTGQDIRIWVVNEKGENVLPEGYNEFDKYFQAKQKQAA